MYFRAIPSIADNEVKNSIWLFATFTVGQQSDFLVKYFFVKKWIFWQIFDKKKIGIIWILIKIIERVLYFLTKLFFIMLNLIDFDQKQRQKFVPRNCSR
jgi:hypothetical protein